MPFTDPPMPSSFDVGLPTGGHAHFDQNGVTFYDTDGVTQVLHMDFATGILTIGPNSGKRLVINPTDNRPLAFYIGNAGETNPAAIYSQADGANAGWVYLQGPDYGAANGPPYIGIHGGSGGYYFYLDTDNGSGSALQYGTNIVDLFGNAYFGAKIRVSSFTDGNQKLLAPCYNSGVTQGMDCGSSTATVGAGGAANYSHNLGVAANSVWVEADSGTVAWQHRLSSSSSVGFSLVVRDNLGNVLASGASSTIRYGIWG